MEILLIILLAPVMLAAGCGLVRLMMEPAFWMVVMVLGGIIGVATMHPH